MRPLRFFVLALFATLIAGCGDSVTLTLKWEKGAAWKQRMTNEIHSTVAGGPTGSFESSSSQLVEMTTRVKDVSTDGTAQVEVTYTRMQIANSGVMGMGATNIDTADPEAMKAASSNPSAKSLAAFATAVLNKPMMMEIAPGGEIRSVKGATQLGEAAAVTGGPQAAIMKAMMTDDSMKQMFAGAYKGWPTTPVKVGSTWEATADAAGAAAMFGEFKITTKSSLKSIRRVGDRRQATIDMTTTMPERTMDPSKSPGAEAMGAAMAKLNMSVKMLEGTGKGKMVFDIEQGRVVSQSMTITIPSEITLPAGPQGGGTVKNTTSVTTSLEVIE